jgi:lipopolysaccharide export LptBFGC system permease protein LptF
MALSSKPAGLAVSSLAALRHHFMRGVLAKATTQTIMVLLLIEAIFLAEKFSAVFSQVVENHASLYSIVLLLLFTSPEIFDIALSIAVLVGVYRALLRVREERELLVMSGAGMGVTQLVGLLLGLALLAQLASLLVSGALAPRAQYAQRVILFDAQYHALREGGSSGQFYEFPNHVVYVGGRAENSDSRRLFIRQTLGPTVRVVTAEKASLEGPDAKGLISLRLRDFLAYDFETEAAKEKPAPQLDCPGCPAIPEAAPSVSMRIRNFTQQFRLDQLLEFAPRGRDNAGEWTLLELLGLLPPPAPSGHDEAKSLGERIARSLICLLAPLLAALALTLTTRATQFIALPLACVVLLGLDLMASTLIGILTPLGNATVLSTLIGIAVAALSLLVALVWRAQRELVRPALGRP